MKLKLIAFLLCATLAPYAHANSAGSYGTGANTVTVETRLVSTPVHTTLEVKITKDGNSSPWTPVTADTGGDGKDVQDSPEIDAGGETYKWKNGRFKRKTDGGWVRMTKETLDSSCPGGDDVVGIPGSGITVP